MKRVVYVKAVITNENDYLSFARKINEMPECAKLTEDERAKIIYSYPVVTEFVPTSPPNDDCSRCQCGFLSRILDKLKHIRIFLK